MRNWEVPNSLSVFWSQQFYKIDGTGISFVSMNLDLNKINVTCRIWMLYLNIYETHWNVKRQTRLKLWCRFIHIHGISREFRLQKAVRWPFEALTLGKHVVARYDIDQIVRGTAGGDGDDESVSRQPERTWSSVHKLNSNVNLPLIGFWYVEGGHCLSDRQLDTFTSSLLWDSIINFIYHKHTYKWCAINDRQ